MAVYLLKKELKSAYSQAKDNARIFFEPFDEYERLAANKIRGNLPNNLPKVNDGSLPALLLEIPMRVLAQLQTGKAKVIDRDEAWLPEIANIEWTKNIVPNANTQAPFFSKMQIGLKRAVDLGACAFFSFFTQRGSYSGADFTVPYIRDILL